MHKCRFIFNMLRKVLQTAAAELNTICTRQHAAARSSGHAAQMYSTASTAADESLSERPLQRFYRSANVSPAPEGGWQVMLDKRSLKSPVGTPLVLPSRLLALAVAAEWEQQISNTIRPFTMPLMTLAATAIDQPKPREQVIETMLQYLHTDSACCRDEPGPLAEYQAQVFDPVLRWAESELQAQLAAGSNIMGMRQSEELVSTARSYLHGLDQWQLAAADAAASACRSVIIGLALVKGKLSVPETLTAARVEEDYQMKKWGLVEGGHDIDIADAAARISAAALFSRLNR